MRRWSEEGDIALIGKCHGSTRLLRVEVHVRSNYFCCSSFFPLEEHDVTELPPTQADVINQLTLQHQHCPFNSRVMVVKPIMRKQRQLYSPFAGRQALKVLLQYLAEKPHKFVRARLSFYHPQARGLKGLIQGGRDLVGFHKHDAGGRSTVLQPHTRNHKSGSEALPTGTSRP